MNTHWPVARRAARGFSHLCEQLEPRTLLANIVVNTISDSPVVSPTISLRSAVAIANAASSPTTITFDPAVFSTLKTIVLTQGELSLSNASHAITINGPSAGLTLSGSNARVLKVTSTASLSRLTITNGKASGIQTSGNLSLSNVTLTNNSSPDYGGGIHQLLGTLSLTNVTLSNNTAVGAGGGLFSYEGNATLKHVTVCGNVAHAGGGILANIRSTFSLSNVTISGNRADTHDGGGMLASGNATLSHVTISGNTAFRRGGGYFHGSSRTLSTISNSVIAGNTAPTTDLLPSPDVLTFAAINSLGFNFIGKSDNSAGWKPTDVLGTIAAPKDPKLNPLNAYGGLTRTMLPLPGSPLINKGSNALIPAGLTTDQRGKTRIFNSTVDIGAVEVQSSSPEIAVRGNNVDIIDGDTTPSTGDHTDFGTVLFASNTTRNFTVQNTGYGTLDVSSLTLPSGFSLTSAFAPKSIAGGASATFTIKLNTTAAGTFQGVVSLLTNDSDEATYTFTIRGIVRPPAPEISVSGSSVNITDGDTTPSISDGTDFGTGNLNAPAILESFTVTNSGTAPLTTSGLTVPAGFSIVDGLSATIAPGASDSFLVRLNSSSVGTFQGTISFNNNDADENPFNFSIKGTIANNSAISGILWEDVNGNGLRETGDNPVGGVKVFLDADRDGVWDSTERWTTSATSGAYSFTGLAVGSHGVAYVLPLGWVNTTAMNLEVPVNGSPVSDKNFGLARHARLTGTVFHDVNGSTFRDTGEVGLQGWTVFLDDDNDGFLDAGEKSVLTDSAGNFSFTGLKPGTHTFKLVLKPGFVVTTQPKHTVPFLSGQSLNRVFGVR